MTTAATLPELRTPTKTAFVRLALKAQCALLRRNWAGPMGDFVMVLRHRGRKSGKLYETPAAYLRQGDDILAISNGRVFANWYLNVVASGEADLIVKGVPLHVRVRKIEARDDIVATFEYFREHYKGFERAFRIAPDAPRELLDQARDRMAYLRMTPA